MFVVGGASLAAARLALRRVAFPSGASCLPACLPGSCLFSIAGPAAPLERSKGEAAI